jgi:arsenate reductase
VSGEGSGLVYQVMFICVHNASRSQMAEAFFNREATPGMRAVSAGTDPLPAVNPLVVRAMAEAGLDLSGHRPKPADERMIAETNYAVTMGCGVDAACPLLIGLKIDEDWDLPDPYGAPIEVVRSIRDEIESRVKDLVNRLNARDRQVR